MDSREKIMFDMGRKRRITDRAKEKNKFKDRGLRRVNFYIEGIEFYKSTITIVKLLTINITA